MGKTHVSIDIILKHRRLTHVNLDESVDINKSINDINTIRENTLKSSNVSAFRRNYHQLIDAVSNPVVSDRVYSYPLSVLEQKPEYCKEEFIKEYTGSIVPAIGTDSLCDLKRNIDGYNFSDEFKKKIVDSADVNIVADRILNNHRNICERCDGIENTILNAYKLGYSTIANQIREYVDTYSIRPYQKMNLCLEETFYILEKNYMFYDRSELVRSMLESFMLSDYEEDNENYKKVLENNYCFTENDVATAMNILTGGSNSNCTIQSIIDEFLRVRTIPFSDLCTNIGCCSINDLKINIGTALDFMLQCINNPSMTYEEMNTGIKNLFDSMANKIATSEDLLSIEDIEDIYTAIHNYIDSTSNKANSELYTNDKAKIESYLNAINMNAEQFLKDCSYLYNRNNIDTMTKLNTESGTVVSLQEYRKFRFSNLVSTALNLDKYLKAKTKSVFKPIAKRVRSKSILARSNKTDGKLKLRKMILKTSNGSSFIFTENSLESIIGEDGKADICVAQYYYNEAYEYECKELFGEICKDFNQTINDPNMRAYYIFNPGIAEIHLKENVYINLTEEERDIVLRTTDPSMTIYTESLVNFSNMSEKLINLDTIVDKIIDQKATITNEQFELLVEALGYTNVSKKQLEAMTEKYTESRYRTLVSEGAENLYEDEVNEISKIIESYTESDEFIPEIIQLEAIGIVADILEARIKKPDIKKAEIKKANASHYNDDDDDEDYDDDDDYDEDDEDEDDKKKESSPQDKAKEKKEVDDIFRPGENKSGLGKFINGIRLALKGLRAKMGDLGSKLGTAGKNLDAASEHLIKAMHDALISDRREAIIKGSVIPSFSRCMAAGVTLAGAGAISMAVIGNIIPVIILAVGAFAVSKKLTKRERLLLLDDIEIELDVVEKEINLAESKNQMKKYRALLKYKKDLQRQYQRIKYNVRIGKDIMAGSATGVYKPEG